MAHQTDTEELIISKAMQLLEAKANSYTPEQYAHYIVKGENEEDFGGESYCEKCIDAAVVTFRLNYLKERAKKRLVIRDLEKDGYVVRVGWIEEFGGRGLRLAFGSKKILRFLKKELKESYPENQTFAYRYYQLDSTPSHEYCESCGKIIHSCVTCDNQEMEHWESLEDVAFLLSSFDAYTAYELYGILEFIRQAEEDVYRRGIALAEKIIKLNNYLL